jgi:hypothetical protein
MQSLLRAVLWSAAPAVTLVGLRGEARELTVVELQKDGEPLDEAIGPFRLVVPSDRRGARWIRQLVGASVVILPKEVGKGAGHGR